MDERERVLMRGWVVILAIVLAAACHPVGISDEPQSVSLSSTGGGSDCVDVGFDELPIDEARLFEEVDTLTGYARDQLEVQRLCKYKDDFLLGILPPQDRRHGLHSLLIIIDLDGEVTISPSM